MTRYVSLTEELTALLRTHRAPPTYALFEQVPEAVGGGGRTADAISMGLWRSRGLTVEGYEIKAYRGDWLRELKTPQKAEPLARFCDYWWIVAPPEIVTVDEMPEAWGLLVPHAKGLRVAKPAPRQEADALTRPFIAGLLRRAARPGEEALARADMAGFERGRQAQKAEAERLKSHDERERDRRLAYVAEFEARAGIQLREWNPVDDFAEAFKLAQSLMQARKQARYARQSLQVALERLDAMETGDAS